MHECLLGFWMNEATPPEHQMPSSGSEPWEWAAFEEGLC